MKVHISKKNSKMGMIPSVSLPPVTTCCENIPCVKDCYALRIYRRLPLVRTQWDENLEFYQSDPGKFFREIWDWVNENKPDFFRWHVGGDIPDVDYLLRMKFLAKSLPKTRFMFFTKRYEWLDDIVTSKGLPPNLIGRLSAWPGVDLPGGSKLPVAWLDMDPRSKNLVNPYHCAGRCDECFACWGEKDVILKFH